MRWLLNHIIGATISGLLVAGISYTVLTPKKFNPKVKVSIETFSIPSEAKDEQFENLQSEIQDFIRNELLNAGLNSEIEDDPLFWLELRNKTPLGHGGEVEEVEIVNDDDTVSSKVKIEGRNIDYAILANGSSEVKIFSDDFSEEVNLLPKQSATVLHYSSYKSYSSYAGSRHVYVSQDGSYFSTSNKPNMLDDIFGPFIDDYPLITFLLIIFGVISVIVLIFQISLEVNQRWMLGLLRVTLSDKDFARYLYLLEGLKETEYDRFERIQEKARNMRKKYE